MCGFGRLPHFHLSAAPCIHNFAFVKMQLYGIPGIQIFKRPQIQHSELLEFANYRMA
jgi:hypothetical protein